MALGTSPGPASTNACNLAVWALAVCGRRYVLGTRRDAPHGRLPHRRQAVASARNGPPSFCRRQKAPYNVAGTLAMRPICKAEFSCVPALGCAKGMIPMVQNNPKNKARQ
jgi:hypothetical protein